MGIECFKAALLSALMMASIIALAIPLSSPGLVHAALTPHDPIYIDGNDNFIPANGVVGGSGAYLLLPGPVEKPAEKSVLEERKERWEKISKTLKDDEQKIYKVILDSDGLINQSELAEKTGLSKSKVSRSLDLLESKGLVERKRRGMGNIVLLKS